MILHGPIRSLLTLLLLTWTLLTPATAQWMFEKMPTAKGSAFEMAGNIPSDVLFVSGFHLKNQIDFRELVRDVKAATAKSADARQEVARMERWLTMPVEDWVALFNGRGFLAMLNPAGTPPSDSWIMALQLDRPGEARQWLKTRDIGKPSEYRGFEIFDLDGTSLGFGKGWVFLTRSRTATEALVATLSGSPRSLERNSTFRRAQASLTGGGSGLFFYLDGDRLRRALYSGLELPEEHPATESLAFWDFAVLSFDFAKEESDGFLGYTERDGKVSTALRKPGRVSAALLDLLPDGLSSASASDVGWAYRALVAFGDEVPEVGMVLGFAHSALSEYGDFDAAFTGTMATGSNALDVLAQFFQFDFIMARRQGQLAACKSNLRNIGTALEMYSTDFSGEYPETLATLTPNYLRVLPVCPTDEAKPYRYTRGGEGEDPYLVNCVGHQHPTLKPESPKYSSNEGIIEQFDEMASSAPVVNAAMEEPSLAVVLPVEGVEAAHDLMVNAVESNKEKPVDSCVQNLSSLATSATFYAYDHDGVYPKALADLVPEYASEIPNCPAVGRETYSESYAVVGDNTGIKLYCKGHNHPELEDDKPLYDTSSEEGVVTGPVARLSGEEKPRAPVNGTSASYEVTDGPKGVLDSANKILRLAYGPKASEILKGQPGSLSKKPLVADSLQWSGESAVYLDYVDLGPLYSAAVEALGKGAAAGSEEAAMALDIIKTLRSRVNGLDGSNCLKVTEKGLHFRSRGVASSQMVGGFIVGAAAVGVPNFARAKSQGQLTACKSNLKNIATALEMWSTDNSGEYPSSLSQVVPDYLRMIPPCPAAEADTYSQTYRLIKSKKYGYTYFEVYCKGHHHAKAGSEEDHPRYNGVTGLVEHPGYSVEEE